LPAYGDDEVLFMATLMNVRKPRYVFEWGTNVGASARIFYEAAVLLEIPCEVHTIELPMELSHLDVDHPGERIGIYLPDDDGHKTVKMCSWWGDGVTMAMELHDSVRPEPTLFYVDGDHRFESVMRELRLIRHKAPTTPILMHDTIHLPDVAKAIETFSREYPGLYRYEQLESQAGMMALWPLGA